MHKWVFNKLAISLPKTLQAFIYSKRHPVSAKFKDTSRHFDTRLDILTLFNWYSYERVRPKCSITHHTHNTMVATNMNSHVFQGWELREVICVWRAALHDPHTPRLKCFFENCSLLLCSNIIKPQFIDRWTFFGREGSYNISRKGQNQFLTLGMYDSMTKKLFHTEA